MAATRKPASRPQGFAALDIERRREIASQGGKAAHAQGRAHQYTSDEARAAGRRGGRTVSADRDHMAAIGRTGGLARAARGPVVRRKAIVTAPPEPIEVASEEEDEGDDE